MKLYELSQQELYGREVISNDDSFISYKLYDDGSLYIHLIFTRKEARRTGSGDKLLNELISKVKPTSLVGYVDLTASNPETALSVHLSYGAKIVKTDSQSITLYKDLK